MSDKLAMLHDMLCDELLRRLKDGEDEGPAKSSTLNVIRQFLKDNNVDALPAEGSHFGDLLAELPPEFRVKN
jgi:hypothetical protein